jgi:hypothetical protein
MNSFGESAVYPAMGNNKALAITAAVSLVVIIFSFAHEVKNLPACRTIEKWARIGNRGIAITKSCNDRARFPIPFSAI